MTRAEVGGNQVGAEYEFLNPLSGQMVTLVIGPDRDTTGVRHFDCPTLAEVFPELDCASCSFCHWQARISGAWYAEVWQENRYPDETLRRLLAEVYRPEGVEIWLTSKHKQFGGLTIDEMKAAGRMNEVFTVVHQLTDGAFA
jgi:hypothetical protein